MLFKIDFTKRSTPESRDSKYVNHAADKYEAVNRFMDDWFFKKHPLDAVRIELITPVEFIGDLSSIDVIDDAVQP